MLSFFFATSNSFTASLIAGLPSSNIPLGILPSGAMPLSSNISSYSDQSVVSIFFILATAIILFFRTSVLESPSPIGS